MRKVEDLEMRELQKLSARVLASTEATNNAMWKFDRVAEHNSRLWYYSVINWYIEEYGGWPDRTGPAEKVKLLYDV